MIDEGWKLAKIVFSGLGSENKSFWHRKTHPDPLTRFPDRISRQIIDIPVRSYSLAIFGFDLGSWRDQTAIGWFRDHPTQLANQFCYRKTFSDPRLDQYQESWGDSRASSREKWSIVLIMCTNYQFRRLVRPKCNRMISGPPYGNSHGILLSENVFRSAIGQISRKLGRFPWVVMIGQKFELKSRFGYQQNPQVGTVYA